MRLDTDGTEPPLPVIAAHTEQTTQRALIMVCGSRNDTVVTTSCRSPTAVDLTCQHKNQTLLVEGPEIMICPVGARQWRMRDRFSAEDLQAMVDLYRSGATAREVAETFGIGLTSAKRVLRDHGIRKR
jgi:hypothetical protein